MCVFISILEIGALNYLLLMQLAMIHIFTVLLTCIF